MAFILRCDRALEKAITYFCDFLFAAIVVVGLINVFCRYVLNNSISWGEELMRYLCIWLIFVGSSLTIRKDGHVAIDLIQSLIKNPTGKMIMYIITRVIAAMTLVLLFPYGLELVRTMGAATSAGTRLPMWVVYLAFPVGSVCMILAYLRTIPDEAKKIREGERT